MKEYWKKWENGDNDHKIGQFFFSPYSDLVFCYAIEPGFGRGDESGREYEWAHVFSFKRLQDIIHENFDDRCPDQRENEDADRLDLDGVAATKLSRPFYCENCTLGCMDQYSLIPELSRHHRAVYVDQDMHEYGKALPVIDKEESEKILSALRMWSQ